MRHLTPLLIASLALLLAVGGCFDSAPAGLSATIDTPASPASGDVAVGFSVSDPDKAPADVTLEYALDGVTFVPATVSGTTTGLASDGTPHAISWDSLADLGATAATGVVLKLTPEAGGKHGAAATSAPFAVDNLVASAGGNAPPTVVIVDPKGASHAGGLIPGETFYGHLLVSLTIADAEGDPASFAVEYSTDGGSTYAAATAADDAPTSGLAAPAGGASHSFLWDSIADLGAVDVEVQLRVTPSDGKPAGRCAAGSCWCTTRRSTRRAGRCCSWWASRRSR